MEVKEEAVRRRLLHYECMHTSAGEIIGMYVVVCIITLERQPSVVPVAQLSWCEGVQHAPPCCEGVRPCNTLVEGGAAACSSLTDLVPFSHIHAM